MITEKQLMTPAELIHAAPLAISQMVESEFKTTDGKLDFLQFLEDELNLVADELKADPDPALNLPLADLFGRIEREREALEASRG